MSQPQTSTSIWHVPSSRKESGFGVRELLSKWGAVLGISHITKHREEILPSNHIFYIQVLSGPSQDGFLILHFLLPLWLMEKSGWALPSQLWSWFRREDRSMHWTEAIPWEFPQAATSFFGFGAYRLMGRQESRTLLWFISLLYIVI